MVCKFCNCDNICNCEKMLTRILGGGGRLCNRLIINLAVSFIAEKIDLYVEYVDYNKFNKLGIPLYIGKNVYKYNILLTDDNYIDILNNPPNANINLDGYFQTQYISKLIYNFVREESIKNNIILKNPFNIRYNNNNDCFVHIRLGDITNTIFNLGLKYYLKSITTVGVFDRLYVASDSPDHEIINKILEVYQGRSEKILMDDVETIQFGSTCKHIILSHGTFSVTIGWLAFDSQVYYPAYEENIWHGDVFSSYPDWYKITNYR